MTYRTLLAALVVGFLAGCGLRREPPLATVAHVELPRYMGLWYEVARYPAWFQRNCVASTAEYALREDGRVAVVNRCIDSADGDERSICGVARTVDGQTNARLKVTFFWPFAGDYWIIDLDRDYRWAVVGEPRRKYLWILSRTPELDDVVYQGILSRLPTKGYDPGRLIRSRPATVARVAAGA